MRRSVRNGVHMRVRCGVVVGVMTGVVLGVVGDVAVGTPAAAEEPLRLDESITDRSGALGDRTDEVQVEIDQLFTDHRLRFWVVYVDDFSDYGEVEWADLTAVESEFGLNDVLLAVATDTGNYALSVDREYDLTDEELDRIDSVAVEPALQERDWAGAAIGAADAFAAVRSGDEVVAPSITPGEPEPVDDDSAMPWVIGGAAVVVAGAAVVGFVVYRRRRTAQSGDEAPRDDPDDKSGDDPRDHPGDDPGDAAEESR